MQKKKDIFLGKVMKKNFNNELELLLEHKDFSEDVKNLLLSMLYKLESAYADYEQVKVNVIPKEYFLQRILEIIENDIDSIEFVKMGSADAKKILANGAIYIDKENKKIICYPIEAKLLYAIVKISQKDNLLDNKYQLLDKAMTNLLNIGNSINFVEPMRDFNGFSWSIVAKDIESIEYNLIYQNLRILLGNEFLNNWIQKNDESIDYYECFKNIMQNEYKDKIKNEFLDVFLSISVLLQIKYNEKCINEYLKTKDKIEKNFKEIEDIEKFTIKFTREKKKINKQIKNLDTLISDKNMLREEYIKRNSKLPLEKKIFSIKVLAKMLKDEREKLVEKKRKINKMLNPQEFVKYHDSLDERYRFLKNIDVERNEVNIKNHLIMLQKVFLEAFNSKIDNVQTQEELLDLIKEFRYYLNIPISKMKKIYGMPKITKILEYIIGKLINRGIEVKLITSVVNDPSLNYNILKEIFITKIINIQNLNIKVSNEDNMIIIEFFDENVFDKKYELQNIPEKEFQIKFNKMVSIFNI